METKCPTCDGVLVRAPMSIPVYDCAACDGEFWLDGQQMRPVQWESCHYEYTKRHGPTYVVEPAPPAYSGDYR